MTDATLPPLRLWQKEVFPEDRAPHFRTIGARWTKSGAVTAKNVRRLVSHLNVLSTRRLQVPPMPEEITVELTPKQFAQLLSSDLADAREWVTLNLTPRVVPPKRGKSGVRGSIATVGSARP